MPDGDVANHQIEESRSSRVMKTPDHHSEIPSIEALARHRLACRNAYTLLEGERHQATKLAGATRIQTDEEDLLDERDIRLRDLITTLQARTMGDAFVQVALIQELLDAFADHDVRRDNLDLEDFHKVLVDVRKVVCLAISVTPVIAAACGKNPADLVDRWCTERAGKRFGAIEQAMGGAA